MKTLIRSLALAGILVSSTMPAHADEIIKTYRYAVNGAPLSVGHVAVEDAPLTKQVIREEAAVIASPGPLVETQTSVVAQNGKLAETRTTTVTSTGRSIEPTATVERIFNDHNEVMVKEFPGLMPGDQEMVREFSAVVEGTQLGNREAAPPDARTEMDKPYWPLFDYSVFDDRVY